MKASTARRIDRLLGLPACALLTGARHLFRRPPPAGPVRRVLFLKLAEQGTFVLAYPAVQRAVEAVGRENVFVLVLEENRPILDVLGQVPARNILAVPSGDAFKALIGTVRVLRKVRALGVDATVDLEFFSRSTAAIGYLTGARTRVGLCSWGGPAPWRGNLLTHRVALQPRLHTAQMYRVLMDALWEPPENLPTLRLVPPPLTDLPLLHFKPGAEDERQVGELLAESFPSSLSGPLVLLNPNAGDLLPLRRWPLDRYAELGRRLLARAPGLRLGVTGTADEAEVCASLVSRIASPGCASLAGRTSLRQLLTLFCLADVLVTNDSGPAHFASTTPVSAICLFGPENPGLFGPPTARATTLWAGLACSPCVSATNDRCSPCTRAWCLEDISVDDVETAVLDVLRDRRGDAEAGPGTLREGPSPR